MSNEQLTPQVQAMRRRVQYLYRQSYNTPEQQDVLSAAFEELAQALEELQSTDEELRQQYEEWLNARAGLEMELQRHQDLFTHAPAGYLVTSLEGTIRQANPAAAALLQSTERLLVGRSLALFVPEGQRRAFRANVAQLTQADRAQEWELTMQSWKSEPFEAGLTIGVLRGATGRPVALYWLLHDIGERKRAEVALRERLAALEQALTSRQAAPDPAPQSAADTAQAAGQMEEDALAQRQFAFLAEASVLLTVAYDLDASLAHVAELAVPAIADGCIVDVADPQEGTIRQIVVARAPDADGSPRIFRRRYTPDPPGQRRAKRGLPNDQGQFVEALPSHVLAQMDDDAELRDILGALRPTSALVVPLRARGQLLGSLTLMLVAEQRRYGPTDLALAQELARRIASAIGRVMF